jgi:hypothetical protein
LNKPVGACSPNLFNILFRVYRSTHSKQGGGGSLLILYEIWSRIAIFCHGFFPKYRACMFADMLQSGKVTTTQHNNIQYTSKPGVILLKMLSETGTKVIWLIIQIIKLKIEVVNHIKDV